jgi:hypothetical protein
MPLKNRNIRELSNIFPADGDWKYVIYDCLNQRERTLKDVLDKVGSTYQHFNITLKTKGINGYKLMSKMFEELGFELVIWVQIRTRKKGNKRRPIVKVKPRANVKGNRPDH